MIPPRSIPHGPLFHDHFSLSFVARVFRVDVHVITSLPFVTIVNVHIIIGLLWAVEKNKPQSER